MLSEIQERPRVHPGGHAIIELTEQLFGILVTAEFDEPWHQQVTDTLVIVRIEPQQILEMGDRLFTSAKGPQTTPPDLPEPACRAVFLQQTPEMADILYEGLLSDGAFALPSTPLAYRSMASSNDFAVCSAKKV